LSVGPTSAAMLNTIALEFIIDRVYLGIYRYTEITSLDFENRNYSCVLKIILFALIAIEKFSHSLESKHILFQSLTIPNQQDKLNVLQYYEPWATSNNCLKRQIGRTRISLLPTKSILLFCFFQVFTLNGYLTMFSFSNLVDQPTKPSIINRLTLC